MAMARTKTRNKEVALPQTFTPKFWEELDGRYAIAKEITRLEIGQVSLCAGFTTGVRNSQKTYVSWNKTSFPSAPPLYFEINGVHRTVGREGPGFRAFGGVRARLLGPRDPSIPTLSAISTSSLCWPNSGSITFSDEI